MKNKIFIFSFNRPDLLPIQVKTIEKYYVGKYELNVVLDCKEKMTPIEEFEKVCEENNIKLWKHNSSGIKSPSQYHADCINYAYRNLLNDGDNVMFLDHDLFFMDEYNFEEEISDYDVIGLRQTREHIDYFWTGLLFFKYSSIKHIDLDFSPMTVEGQMLDSAGDTYRIVRDKNVKFKYVDQVYPDEYNDIDLKDEKISNGFPYEIFENYTFLHTKNASNWHTNFKLTENEKTKTDCVKKIINEILSC